MQDTLPLRAAGVETYLKTVLTGQFYSLEYLKIISNEFAHFYTFSHFPQKQCTKLPNLFKMSGNLKTKPPYLFYFVFAVL